LARTALRSTRRIIADLRPQVLEELGLVAALHDLGEVHTARTGTPCQVETDESLDHLELPPPVSGCLYRVAQEAMNNIAKHAHASRAGIALHRGDDGELHLRVTDDGCGFAADAGPRPQAFGLMGMAERVHAVGGRLSILSGSQSGTVVEVVLPPGGQAAQPGEAARP
ncbi:MAG TPA: sensor histidine kinase, partial [Burkholderiaceae bacterium]